MAGDKITEILQLIKHDQCLEDYFFKKVAAATNPLEWLMPLKEAGYFSPDRNQKPQETGAGYHVPQWNVLDALVNMSAKNEQAPEATVSGSLLGIVNEIIAYRESGERIDNPITDAKVLAVISHFPIDQIDDNHVTFIGDALQTDRDTHFISNTICGSLLPKAIKQGSEPLVLSLLEIILRFKKSGKDYSDKYVSIINDYYFKNVLKKNRKGIASLCAAKAAEVALSKIREILEVDDSQFGGSWIPTVEDHEQGFYSDRYGRELVTFARDMLEDSAPLEIETLVDGLFREDHEMLRRLAFHAINHHYAALSKILWRTDANPLNISAIHELFELFKAHCKDFTPAQIDKALQWIETQKFVFSERVSGDTEEEERVKAYRKKEWLMALLDSGNANVGDRYDHYNSINDAIIDRPGFRFWSYGVHSVEEVSPISKEEVEKMTNEELAAYINSYKPTDEPRFSKDFTRVSLTSALRTFVSGNPERFASNLGPFHSVHPKYQDELIKGFRDACRSEKLFDLTAVLSFALQLLDTATFWDESSPEDIKKNREWITQSVAEFIQDGTKNGKHAFPSEALHIVEAMLVILLRMVPGTVNTLDGVYSSVINTSRGRILLAAITYSLRYARLVKAEEGAKWTDPIKNAFDDCLDKGKHPSFEFSETAGSCLPNLHYLDSDWVTANFDRIFDLGSDAHWEAAFTGYSLSATTIYEDIYGLLRDHGHFKKALAHPFTDKTVADKLVQILAVGYLADLDSFPDASSLMRELLESGNPKSISALVKFMPSTKGKDDKDVGKVKALWRVIVVKIQPHLEEKRYRVIASNLGMWLELVDEIDEEVYGWLELSIPFIEEDWNAMHVIPLLLKHAATTPEMVGKLYAKMADSGVFPVYPEEEIIATVQVLYDYKLNETATKICNAYLAQGHTLLIKTCTDNMSAATAKE